MFICILRFHNFYPLPALLHPFYPLVFNVKHFFPSFHCLKFQISLMVVCSIFCTLISSYFPEAKTFQQSQIRTYFLIKQQANLQRSLFPFQFSFLGTMRWKTACSAPAFRCKLNFSKSASLVFTSYILTLESALSTVYVSLFFVSRIDVLSPRTNNWLLNRFGRQFTLAPLLSKHKTGWSCCVKA